MLCQKLPRGCQGRIQIQIQIQEAIYDILSFQTDSSNPPTLPLSAPRPSDSTVTLCFCAVGRVVTMTTHGI